MLPKLKTLSIISCLDFEISSCTGSTSQKYDLLNMLRISVTIIVFYKDSKNPVIIGLLIRVRRLETRNRRTEAKGMGQGRKVKGQKLKVKDQRKLTTQNSELTTPKANSQEPRGKG